MNFFDSATVVVAILLLGATILIAFGSDALSQRFRVPDVLWLILFGLLAGPIFHIVSPSQVTEIGAIVGTIALVIILYDAGIDFNPREARSVGVSGLLLAVLSFGLSAVALFLVAYLLLTNYDLTTSVVFALALAGISGAVTIPLGARLGLSAPSRDTLNLDLAIEDTLGVLSVTVLLSVLASPNAGIGAIVPEVLLPLPLAIIFGVLGGLAAIEFLTRWQQRVYAGLAVMGLLLVVYAGTQYLDGSGIIAALIMGVVLGNDSFFRRWLPRTMSPNFAFDPTVRQVHNDIAFVLRALFLVILGIIVPIQPLGVTVAAAAVALPFVLLLLRRYVLQDLAGRQRVSSKEWPRLAGLYGRGLTNAVLLILALALIPAMNSLLFPALIVIIGTDVLMTALVFLDRGSGPSAPSPTSSGGP